MKKGELEGWIYGSTVTTIYYLLAKKLNTEKADKHVRNLLKIFNISLVNRVVIEDALAVDFSDFEDAVLYQSAMHSNVSGITTRNHEDFEKSELPVYTPAQLIKALQSLS